MSYEGPVRMTAELERVLAIPRRILDFDAPEVEALRWSWTPMLLNETGLQVFNEICALPIPQRDAEFARWGLPRDQGGENCPLLLSAEQAVALYEAFHVKGAFIAAGVGFGKTLMSWLLAFIFGAARPLLLVTGGLVAKTHDDFRDLARCWKAPFVLPDVLSFERLGKPGGEALLCDCVKCMKTEPITPGGFRPTHIFADEADKLRNPQAAVTKRVGRYMSQHSGTVYVGMTGTGWRKSIKNAAPQLIWALKWGAPVPVNYMDITAWSEALDLSTRAAPRDPGALCWLSNINPKDVLSYKERVEVSKSGFKNRLLQTRGIVQTRGQSCDQPIHVRFIKAPDDPILDSAFFEYRKTGKTLDGWDVSDPLSSRKHAGELSGGFFYAWDPRPPKEYLEARSNAATFVREKILESGRRGRPLDSSGPVYLAHPNEPILLHWLEVEKAFGKPNVVARPISMSVLAYAAEWMKENGPALIWVQHGYIGRTLSQLTGVPYFGAQGKDPQGRYIGAYSSKKNAIVSVKANERGRNLQGWHKCLIIVPPEAATIWEQALFGRMHRKGQANPVFADVLISCGENIRAVEKAKDEVEWGEDTVGSEQKLLIAEYDHTYFPRAELESLPPEHPSRARWNVPGA